MSRKKQQPSKADVERFFENILRVLREREAKREAERKAELEAMFKNK